MSKIEEVKKRLDEPVCCEDGRMHSIDENNKRYLSWLICQLFPKSADAPDEYKPKPDKSRLLTPKQIIALVDSPPSESELALALIARAECGWCDTPLIKEGGCQARVERIFKDFEALVDLSELPFIRDVWQALKRREVKDG